MDEKTLQALTQLANKLGTTAEYLWGVLLKQAPLSGAMDLAIYTAWIVVGVLLTTYVRSNTKGDEPHWTDEVARLFAWAGIGCYWFFALFIVSIGLGDAVIAIVNPEYWALRQILK